MIDINLIKNQLIVRFANRKYKMKNKCSLINLLATEAAQHELNSWYTYKFECVRQFVFFYVCMLNFGIHAQLRL